MNRRSIQQARYDRLYRQSKFDLFRPDEPSPLLNYLINHNLLQGFASMIDLGCGIGEDVRLAITKYGFGHSIGIDTSRRAIDNAIAITKTQVNPADRTKIEFICGRLEDASIKLDTYDLVASISVIHLMHPDEAFTFIKSASALINPGGIFAVAVKTPKSQDAQPASRGGISVRTIKEGSDYSLKLSDDGIERYYYSPAKLSSMITDATSLKVRTDTIVTTYDYKRPIKNCEFAVAIAEKP